MTLHCVRRRRTQSILQGKATNFVYAATEVEALYARFSKFLWLVTYLCHFYRHFEFICTHHHHARIHCHEVNSSLSFPVDFGCCFFCLVKLSCRMFKGFVASICHSLRTFATLLGHVETTSLALSSWDETCLCQLTSFRRCTNV